MSDRRRLVYVCACVAALAIAALAARIQWGFPIGRERTGYAISNPGFALQLGALVVGIAIIHCIDASRARWVLACEGALCALGYGSAGACFLAGLAAWYGALTLRLGVLRWPCLLGLLAALHALAWSEHYLLALVFSMTFTLRLVLFAWDRWQNDFEPAPWLEYAVYMLAPPLVIVPPFLTIMPFFDGFAARTSTGMTAERSRAILRHAAWAVVFGGLLAVGTSIKFLELVLFVATLGHALIALLLLHGIDERMPLRRPLLATSYLELWNRFMIHQKDVQVALFYAPALLRLRRRNRYVAQLLAVAWTMLVGNFLIHAIVSYPFYYARYADAWSRLPLVVLTNAIIAAALAIDLCRTEWRRSHGTPSPAWWRTALGWAYTMTIATACSSLL